MLPSSVPFASSGAPSGAPGAANSGVPTAAGPAPGEEAGSAPASTSTPSVAAGGAAVGGTGTGTSGGSGAGAATGAFGGSGPSAPTGASGGNGGPASGTAGGKAAGAGSDAGTGKGTVLEQEGTQASSGASGTGGTSGTAGAAGAAAGIGPTSVGDALGLLRAPVSGKVLRPFGWYESSLFQDWRYHTGVDLAVSAGDQVRAAGPGLVVAVEGTALEGWRVVISHGQGVTTVYSHLGSAAVAEGDQVAAGQTIGLAGAPGSLEADLGVHLHFEIRVNDSPTDPTPYLGR